jgi:hypothetical protein
LYESTENRSFHYAVHGVEVRSNRPLDVFAPIDGESMPRLDIWLGSWDDLCRRHPEITSFVLPQVNSRPAGAVLPRRKTSRGDALLCCSGNEHHFLGAVLSASGNSIEVGWRRAPGEPAGLEEAVTAYLLSNLVGMAVRLSGQIVLHGNAVGIGDRAVLCVGEKGAGKSTLAAAFVNAGCPLLADDQVVIRPVGDGFMVAPGIRRLRLFSEDVHMRRFLEATYPFYEPFGPKIKGYFDMARNGEWPAISRLTPLDAVYVIQPRAKLRSPVIETPRSGEQLYLLLSHCVGRRMLPMSAPQQRAEFYAIGKMVGRVPVRFLHLPDDVASLPEAVGLLAERCRHD